MVTAIVPIRGSGTNMTKLVKIMGVCADSSRNLKLTTMTSVKGPAPPPTNLDGSTLRIAIVHARWNKEVIHSLVTGTVTKLKALGVKESNIVVQSVPGSFELPLACSKCALLPCILQLFDVFLSG